MRIRYLLPLTAGLSIIATGLWAGPVVQSLRPIARPVADPVPVPAATASASLATPAQSLRPALRPANLSADPIVSTKNAAFQRWVDQYKPRAIARGIPARVVDQAFRGVRYNTDVISKDRNQAEFKREIWDYLDSAASPVRVDNGRAALRKHGRILDRIERHYGVEKEVVLAVWGMESTYGERRGDIDVIEALSTLSFDGRRWAFFEKQLHAALQILAAGDVSPRDMKGSWAGAMGHTQFIPTSYLAYAVDFTGDGKRDIWSDDPTDALASTAAYLKRFGWTKGQPWGVEVQMPRGMDAGQASPKIRRTPSDWAKLGVVDLRGRAVPNHGPASLFLPAGRSGPAFLTFNNFNVIKRYNNANSYAMGVGHLADRIGGGPEIQGAWPRGYAPLSFDEKKELQRLLQRRGYAIEKIDGIIGPNSRNAISAFQQSVGAPVDGNPSQDVLRLLKRR